MTITKYTFFSPNGDDFPVTANADGKLYMMLTGMSYSDYRVKFWSNPINTALNRVYTNVSLVVAGRYFELSDHAVTLKPAQTNYIHAVIDLASVSDPVTITVEDNDNSTDVDINNESGVLKRCFDIVVTNGSSVTSAKRPEGQTLTMENIKATNTIDMGRTKTVSFATGWGRTISVTRVGNMVIAYSESRYTGDMPQGAWNKANEKVPVGFRPSGQNALIPLHDLSNSTKFGWLRFGTDGGISHFLNGGVKTTDYMLNGSTTYYTNEPFPE
nr:MAG TPA: receptor binding protein [Caudoviricetes sp.]